MIWWIAQNTVIAAALAVVVALACRCGKLSPATRHLLWLLVLIKLVSPPLVRWPWPIPDRGLQLLQSAKTIAARDVSAMAVGGDLAISDVVVGSELIVVPAGSRESLHFDPIAVQSTSPDQSSACRANPTSIIPRVMHFLPVFWGAGALVVVLLQAIQIVRMQRRLVGAHRAPEWFAQQVAVTAPRLGVRPPRTLIVDGLQSPVLWALGRPTLLWPRGLLSGVSPAAREGIIVHELAHLHRRDHWVGRMELLCACVWWWNPLFWYIRRQLHENAELACDAWVMQCIPDGRRAYAEVLVSICELMSQPKMLPGGALSMGGPRRELERRLTMILRANHVSSRTPRLALATVLVLALATLPGWSQSVQRQPEPVAPAENRTPAAVDAEAVPPEIQEEPITVQVENVPSVRNVPRRVHQNRVSRPSRPGTRGNEGLNAAGGANEIADPSARNVNDSRVARSLNGPVAGRSQGKDKLQKLEQRLQGLLNEVQSLRRAPDAAGVGETMTQAGIGTFIDVSESMLGGAVARAPRTEPVANGATVTTQTITLSRTTYRLPTLKQAQALAAFLQEHVGGDMQVRVHPQSANVAGGAAGAVTEYVQFAALITITTTPNAQETIAGLITLMANNATKVPTQTGGEGPEANYSGATPGQARPYIYTLTPATTETLPPAAAGGAVYFQPEPAQRPAQRNSPPPIEPTVPQPVPTTGR